KIIKFALFVVKCIQILKAMKVNKYFSFSLHDISEFVKPLSTEKYIIDSFKKSWIFMGLDNR
ncbi:hypothetical protein KY200_003814, partial [Acinetobacter baumannii]